MSHNESMPPHPSAPAPTDQLLDISDLSGTVSWPSLFDLNVAEALSRPVEFEIGCGNGRFLSRAATERPDSLFIGVERCRKYARFARDRMLKYGIGNVRIIYGDAIKVLAHHMPADSIDALHVYFPDPWPKRKHAKRRLFQQPFFEMLHRVLSPDARVHVKVDLFWYFEEILCRFERTPRFQVLANGMEDDADRDLTDITGFEQKALRRKGRIFHLKARHTMEDATT